MSLQFSPTLRNAWLDAIYTVTGPQPHLDLWTGSPPISCLYPPSGSLVASLQLPVNWIQKAGLSGTPGTISFVVPQSTTAILGALIGHFRLYTFDRSQCVMQGTAGANVGTTPPDLVITNPSPVVGQIVNLVSLTFTAPGA